MMIWCETDTSDGAITVTVANQIALLDEVCAPFSVDTALTR